jgi:uncharacterized membrane protein YfcA
MHSTLLLSAVFALIAALFASVGQAGGAGYVAVMGLFGYGPAAIKVTALALTILVATIGVWRFSRSGFLKWRDWYPFAVLGVPGALLGGIINLPGGAYRAVIAVLLLAAGVQMILSASGAQAHDQRAEAEPPLLPAIAVGGAVGLIAGITGVGGGIFLVPLLLSLKWAPTKRAAAIAQVNNLYTAAAALAGAWATSPALPPQLPWWALAAGMGGLLGAWAGARHLPVSLLRYILAAILIASGLRLALV